LGDDKNNHETSHIEPENGAGSGHDLTPSPTEDERLFDLISSIKKIEEYLIVRNSEKLIEENWLFSEGSSSFYVWLKETYRRRSLRTRFFNSDYFSGEAAWNIVLDLGAARIEGKRISVTSACIASGVPSTTALRWISILENDGMIIRETDFTDRRRTFIRISDHAMDLLNSYFNTLHSHPRTTRRGS
jgi:hypothetical protein